MPARLLLGAPAAQSILRDVAARAKVLKPTLTIVQVGSDPSSTAYIGRKLNACEQTGIRSEHVQLPEETSLEELLQVTAKLNADRTVTGYILQLPLPSALTEYLPEILRSIDPKKDVDGLTAYNLGKLLLAKNFEHLPPATPEGIIHLLAHYEIDCAGKHAVIVGRSSIVGKPLALMLLHRDATVTICHSKTPALAEHTRRADLLVCAVGSPRLIRGTMVKQGAVVIDVGITRTDEGLVGDVDLDEVSEVASAITPVPGGVGPMTVACLLKNVITAAERQARL